MLLEKWLGKLVVDGDSANYAFVDRIGKGIGIFYYTFEHAARPNIKQRRNFYFKKATQQILQKSNFLVIVAICILLAM